MSTMDDLIKWLRAQLDEDEGLARHAFGEHNHAKPEWTEIWSGTVDTGGGGDEEIACFDAGFSRHIVNFDPARVLREVEAKRRMLWLVQAAFSVEPGRDMAALVVRAERSVLREVAKALAMPFSDRPGYREEWRP